MINPLEEAITQRAKVRILSVLSEKDRLSITQLSRLTGLNHNIVDKSVLDLKEMKLIKEYRVGYSRQIELNFRELNVNFTKKQGMTIDLVLARNK